jgi:hypothetical protein
MLTQRVSVRSAVLEEDEDKAKEKVMVQSSFLVAIHGRGSH